MKKWLHVLIAGVFLWTFSLIPAAGGGYTPELQKIIEVAKTGERVEAVPACTAKTVKQPGRAIVFMYCDSDKSAGMMYMEPRGGMLVAYFPNSDQYCYQVFTADQVVAEGETTEEKAKEFYDEMMLEAARNGSKDLLL